MLRALVVLIFISFAMNAAGQEGVTHEPTSATDGEVRLHNQKKPRVKKSSRSRSTDRQSPSARASKNNKSEVRNADERQGSSLRRSRGSRKMKGESRVYRKHATATTNESTRKAKVKRSLGKNTEY
jgi:hypothetical protein